MQESREFGFEICIESRIYAYSLQCASVHLHRYQRVHRSGAPASSRATESKNPIGAGVSSGVYYRIAVCVYVYPYNNVCIYYTLKVYTVFPELCRRRPYYDSKSRSGCETTLEYQTVPHRPHPSFLFHSYSNTHILRIAR